MRILSRPMIVAAVTVMAGGAILWHAEAQQPLCVGDHPAKRPPDCTTSQVPGCITYGGLPKRAGYQRDHFIAEGLCRGEGWCDVAVPDPSRPPAPDNQGNVWYEPWSEAHAKDDVEWAAIASYCRGEVSLEGARAAVERWRQ
jgi:hypothetical protein